VSKTEAGGGTSKLKVNKNISKSSVHPSNENFKKILIAEQRDLTKSSKKITRYIIGNTVIHGTKQHFSDPMSFARD
jgi:hypothetical protein